MVLDGLVLSVLDALSERLLFLITIFHESRFIINIVLQVHVCSLASTLSPFTPLSLSQH